MNNPKHLPRLMAAAKEFNIGAITLVDFLVSQGFDSKNLLPTSRLTEPMYESLQKEFHQDKVAKQKSSQIDLPPRDPRGIDKITLADVDISIRPSHRIDAAVKLVEDCLTLNARYLELGNCGLLDEHFIVNSKLDLLLKQCTQLETLILSNAWWSESNKEDNYRYYTTSLNSGRPNRITKIPNFVLSLTGLTTLIVSEYDSNNKGIFNIDSISTLINLKYLDLSNNRINELGRSFDNLFNLKVLDLSHNQIETVEALENLIELRSLNVADNNIMSLTGISKLQKLQDLYLQNNLIESIEELFLLRNLQKLILNNNQIKKIGNLKKLGKLETLNLAGNLIEEPFGLEFLLEREISLIIDETPLEKNYNLKLEKNENHFPFMKELLMRQLDESKKSSLTYPVKILMLGNHGTGKSSLVDYLARTSNSGSTHILRIENYYSESGNEQVLPVAIFFDFGGQDFYHGLYQAFISKNSIQIILFDIANDQNKIGVDNNGIPIINFNRRYWLGQKKYLEVNSEEADPYLMIQSFAEKEEQEALSLNYQTYRGYKKGFYLSLANNTVDISDSTQHFFNLGKAYFKSYFDLLISRFHNTVEEPHWYINFLKFIINKENSGHTPVHLSEVLKHYRVRDLEDDERLLSLKTNLVTLHRHGLVMYYPQIEKLENIVWLNPQKLVEHIQDSVLNRALIDEKKHKVPGIISEMEFESMVSDELIILLLKEQKVIFLHKPSDNPKDNEYIIPNYLPLLDKNSSDSQLFTFGLDSPVFVIYFNDFIPFGFINQMICFFGKQPDVKKFWRNQLLFTLQNEIRILIELDFEQLKIKVHFQILNKSISLHKAVKEYLYYTIIAFYWNVDSETILSFEEFLALDSKQTKSDNEINDRFDLWRALKNDPKYIPSDAFVSVDDRRFVSCFDLFLLESSQFRIVSYGLKDNKINKNDSIEIPVKAFEEFTNKKLRTMKKVFVSYSKYDEDYLQDFEDHLITLKEEGVATFNCRKIEFGKEWDEEIRRQIDECDIMICLVSVKFLNTDYITKIEIPKAIEQSKIIVPIIIKACDWENSQLGKYQAAQRGRIVSLNNSLKLKGRIKGFSEEEKAAFWADIVKEFRSKLLLP